MNEAKKELFYKAVFKDQATAEDLLKKTPEEVAAYLKNQGLDFSVEEVVSCGEELKKAAGAGKGELKESELENVAGGGVGGFLAGYGVGATVGIYLVFGVIW